MTDNYARIVRDNLDALYRDLPTHLADSLPARREGRAYFFEAFGAPCRIAPEGITLDGEPQTGVLGILLSLYARHACPAPCVLAPLKAFKDLPDSMPYQGAFITHTENVLLPHVPQIKAQASLIKASLGGETPLGDLAGDFAFVVHPLPKIALGYIFYEADEEFSASVTCLYSQNADLFLPTDALADVGEYCSKKILSIIGRE